MSLKILHRIYFGFDGKPDLYREYLETWKRELPGYEIKHWNASNLPLDLNEYTKTMADKKDAVFLGDFFRWWILKEYGGIYLDADIEIVDGKKFNALIEDLESSAGCDTLIGIDTTDGFYTAHSMACKKNAELAKFMCNLYQNMGPFAHWRKNFPAPMLVTLYFMEKGLLTENEGRLLNCTSPATFAGVKIYPKDYLSPLRYWSDGANFKFWPEDFTKNTALCHHYGCSWHQKNSIFYGKGQETEQYRKMLADYISETKSGNVLFLKRIPRKLWRMFKSIPRAIYMGLKEIRRA